MSNIDDILPPPYQTYVILVEQDSDFDHSLAWFIQHSKEQGIYGMFDHISVPHKIPAILIDEDVIN